MAASSARRSAAPSSVTRWDRRSASAGCYPPLTPTSRRISVRSHPAWMDGVRLGQAMRALRRHRGWTQDELACRAHVSQASISRVETGEAIRLTMRTVERMAEALGARLSVRVYWHGEELDSARRRRSRRHRGSGHCNPGRERLGGLPGDDVQPLRRTRVHRRAGLASRPSGAVDHRSEVGRAGRPSAARRRRSKGSDRSDDRFREEVARPDDLEAHRPARRPDGSAAGRNVLGDVRSGVPVFAARGVRRWMASPPKRCPGSCSCHPFKARVQDIGSGRC